MPFSVNVVLRRHLRCFGSRPGTSLMLRCGPDGPGCHVWGSVLLRIRGDAGKTLEMWRINIIIVQKTSRL